VDVSTHLAVLRRFKWLIVAGFVLAILLSVLSVAKVSAKGLQYRKPQLWASHETLLVTQTGFPIGQSVYNEVVPLQTGDRPVATGPNSSGTYVPRFADPGRFSTLAVLYARLANSDPVIHLLVTHGRVPGGVSLSANAVWDTQIGALPLIEMTGMGTSEAAAIAMAHNGAESLRTYIAGQQAANNVPTDSRVILTTIKRAGAPSGIADGLPGTFVVSGHSKMKPMVVFLGILGLFIATAYALENLRPRIRRAYEVQQQARSRKRSAA
jgi:hypothetical protein